MHILKGFTETDDKYKEAVLFWSNEIKKKIADYYTYSQFINNSKTGTSIIRDGNPVFSLINRDKTKALRIMQNEPRSDKPYIAAWAEDINDKTNSLPMLSIGLELSDITLEKALELIHTWFDNYEEKKFNHLLNSINSKFEKNYVKSEIEKAIELNDDIEELRK